MVSIVPRGTSLLRNYFPRRCIAIDIVTLAKTFSVESTAFSNRTTVGDLAQTIVPFGTTAVPDKRSFRKGFSLPFLSTTLPDAGWFNQGPAVYRNEKEVEHAKSTGSVWPKGCRYLEAGETEVAPCHTNPGGGSWHYYDVFAFACEETPATYVLGPYQVAKVWKQAQFSRTCYDDSVISGFTQYRAKGAVIDTKSMQYRLLDIELSGTKVDAKSPSEAIECLRSLTVHVTAEGRWQRFSWSESRLKADTDVLAQRLRSKQQVVLSGLDNLTGYTGYWGDESRTGTTERYLARGEVVTKLADQVGRLVNNNAALLLEVGNILKELVSLFRGNPSGLRTLLRDIRTVRDAKQAAKIVANVRLSSQYGIRLTVQDVLTVAAALNRVRSSDEIARTAVAYSCPFRCGTAAVTEHWKMFYSASPAKVPAMASLFLSDLIGFNNIWDLIPYSFVVDWFAPVGDILQGWDDELMLSYLPIHAIMVGEKATSSASWADDEADYTVFCSIYRRRKVSSFPPYATTTSHSLSTNIVLNGAALIVQRL